MANFHFFLVVLFVAGAAQINGQYKFYISFRVLISICHLVNFESKFALESIGCVRLKMQ